MNLFRLGSCICCFLPAWALAGPICPPMPIRLDYFEFGLFYSSAGGTRAGDGIDSAIVEELARRSGCSFDAQLQARARTWIELQSGRLDMTVSGLRTNERDSFAWFLPYTRLQHSVLLGPSAPASVATLEQFQSAPTLKFGVVRGFRHSTFYDPLIEQWKLAGRVIEYVDEALLVAALQRGDVAAMLSYPAVYRRYLSADEASLKIRVRDWDSDTIGINGHLVLSKERFSRTEMLKWEQLLKDMRRDGTLLKVFRKYLSAEEAVRMLP